MPSDWPVQGYRMRQRQKVNRSYFNDEVAVHTSWDPLVAPHSGLTDANHLAVRWGQGKNEHILLLPAALTTLSPLVVAVASALVLYIWITNLGSTGLLNGLLLILLSLAGLTWGVLRLKLLFTIFPIRFTKTTCLVWDSRASFQRSISLQGLHALQVVPKGRMRTMRECEFLFELNLIYSGDNIKRINILNQPSRLLVRRAAWLLSNYLSVPVWDGTIYAIEE